MKRILLALTFLCSLIAPVQGQMMTGNVLKHSMEGLFRTLESKPLNDDYKDVNRAMGYVYAVLDMNNGIFFCPPNEVTISQVFQLTLKDMRESPEDLHKVGALFIVRALGNTFPCPKKK